MITKGSVSLTLSKLKLKIQMLATRLVIVALAFTGTHAVSVQTDLAQVAEINLAQYINPMQVEEAHKRKKQLSDYDDFDWDSVM